MTKIEVREIWMSVLLTASLWSLALSLVIASCKKVTKGERKTGWITFWLGAAGLLLSVLLFPYLDT